MSTKIITVPMREKHVKTMNVKLDPGAILPKRAYPSDAGLDLFTPKDIIIPAMSSVCVDTGVHVAIPEGFCGRITSKSGIMRNLGVTSEGLIDASYRGPINAVLFNHTDKMVIFERGQKITQLVIQPCETPELAIVDELDETDRGSNGFGSTGANYGKVLP